jgi:hypothetical protein
MKYFKFAQISQDTGISWAIAQPLSGPSWPSIPGLNLNESIQLSHSPIYYLAKASDDAIPNPENHIFELTASEYAQELQQHVMHILNAEAESIYREEYEFRQAIFSKYHDTASIAGIYKYEQAKQLIADSLAEAPEVRAEASLRGVDSVIMAQRIITNHENFRAEEAKIAGIRGKILDRLNSFEFDLANADSSYIEALSEETIGTEIITDFEGGQPIEKQIDVKVRKYVLDLAARFKYE